MAWSILIAFVAGAISGAVVLAVVAALVAGARNDDFGPHL